MVTVCFTGRVFPAHFQVTLTLPPIDWEDKPTGMSMRFTTEYRNGEVRVECTTNKLESDQHMIEIYNRAFDIARSGLDLISFSTGRPYTVVIEKFTKPDGQTVPFSISQLDLARLCTAFGPGQTYLEVLKLVIAEPPVFYALRELIESISYPRRPLINCARAIDILRTQMAPTVARSQGWPEMRTNLNLSESYLRFITEYSKDWRHGNYTPIPPKTIQEVTERSWTVMNRFLEFRKWGNRPLPTTEFPLLT
jgi:hypothetical protein